MRFYYMDALRSILMTMGVFYHAAAVYTPGPTWRVPTDDAHVVFEWIAGAIHSFRMPAFFVIAGFFCLLTLEKYGEGRFLRHRLLRTGVPLASTALLVNTWMNYLSWDNYRQLGFVEYVLSAAYWQEGTWVGHLWFLNNLLVYFMLTFLLALALRQSQLEPLRRRIARTCEMLPRIPQLPLMLAILLPLANMLLVRVAWQFDNAYLAYLIEPASLALHLPYFAFGMLMYHQRDLVAALSGQRFWVAGLALAAVCLLLPVGLADYRLEYAGYLVAWSMAGLCLALFQRLFDRPSHGFLYFSNASYTIYLFHQLLVVLFAVALAGSGLNVFAKYAIVVGATFLVATVIHHYLVLRVPVLRLLFNGMTSGDGERRVAQMATPRQVTDP